MRAVLIFFFLILFIFLFSHPAQAVSISIDDYPQKLTATEFQIHITVNGAKPAINYFEILLYPEKVKDSHVRTWNGNTWYEGNDNKQYFAASASATTSLELKAQVPEQVENGPYFLSVRRFTASGSSADDHISPVNVVLSIERQTPTSISTSTPSPTPTSTPASVVEPTEEATPEVLAVMTSSIPTETPTVDPSSEPPLTEPENQSKKPPNAFLLLSIPVFLGGIGLSLVGLSLVLKRYKQLV